MPTLTRYKKRACKPEEFETISCGWSGAPEPEDQRYVVQVFSNCRESVSLEMSQAEAVGVVQSLMRFLSDHAGFVPCPACFGRGKEKSDWRNSFRQTVCTSCNGLGKMEKGGEAPADPPARVL